MAKTLILLLMLLPLLRWRPELFSRRRRAELLLTAKRFTFQGATCATTSALRAACCETAGAVVADSINCTLAVEVAAEDGTRVGAKVEGSSSGKVGTGEGQSMDVGAEDGRREGTKEGCCDGALVIKVGAVEGAKLGSKVGDCNG